MFHCYKVKDKDKDKDLDRIGPNGKHQETIVLNTGSDSKAVPTPCHFGDGLVKILCLSFF